MPETLRTIFIKLKNPWISLPAIGVAAMYLVYFVETKLFPEVSDINWLYFIFAGILGAVGVALFFAFAARMAKIENRNWQKAFTAAIGLIVIEALAALIYLPIKHTPKVFLVMLAFLAVGAVWFMLRRVYIVGNKKVLSFFVWFFGLLAALSFVIGLIGSLLLGKYT